MISSINSELRLISVFILVIFTGIQLQAQEKSILKGKVISTNQDIEKIHVINMNLEKGTITNANGEFEIEAKINDSLFFSSVQFENKTVVVTQQMLNSEIVSVELSDKMNELAEVVIDDIKLSGYLANDIGRISTADFEETTKLQNNLHAFIEKDREQNPYVRSIANAGIRLDKIAGAVIDKLSKDKVSVPRYTPRQIANKSIQIVGYQFFSEELGLTENEICNFVYFCTEDAPRFKNLVLNSNALVLIEYFENRIDDFKKRRGNLFNVENQIPG